MKLPNADRAMISPDKLVEYLLNVEPDRGGSKARLLLEFGYSREYWQRLERDIQSVHLSADVKSVRETAYGTRYEISELIETPSGRTLRLRTIWQIGTGAELPRLITLFPD